MPNVQNGTYFVRVRARNADGTGTPSNEIQLTVGTGACATPPSSPSTLAGNVSGSTVSLLWAGSAGGCAPTGYVVRAGSAPGQTDLTTLLVGANTSLNVTAPPGTYFVTVVAQNAFGSSSPSNEVVVTVGPSCTLPGPPVAFSARSTGDAASFSWSAPASGGAPDRYLLEAGSASGAANLASVPVSSLAYNTPVPSGTYFVRVRAQNACGVGPASPEQILTLACVGPGIPTAPTVSVSGSTATLSWAGVSGATSYRLDVGTAAGASNISSQVVSGTSQQLSGLSSGMFFARVTALNSCGASSASPERLFSIAGPTPPAPNSSASDAPAVERVLQRTCSGFVRHAHGALQ